MLARLCPADGGYHHNDMARRKPPSLPTSIPTRIRI